MLSVVFFRLDPPRRTIEKIYCCLYTIRRNGPPGIDSLEQIPGLLKRLQIRALVSVVEEMALIVFMKKYYKSFAWTRVCVFFKNLCFVALLQQNAVDVKYNIQFMIHFTIRKHCKNHGQLNCTKRTENFNSALSICISNPPWEGPETYFLGLKQTS